MLFQASDVCPSLFFLFRFSFFFLNARLVHQKQLENSRKMYFILRTHTGTHTHSQKNEDALSFTDPDRNGIRFEAFFIPDVIFFFLTFFSILWAVFIMSKSSKKQNIRI